MNTTPALSEYMTGNVRYRRGYDHDEVDPPAMMVLQVEISRFYPSNTEYAGKWVCEFRDATEQDLRARGDIIV